MKQPRVALDLESNGFHRYPERVCLIQLALHDGDACLIDPIAVQDMTPLGELLAAQSVQKIFHSADYDIRSLHRDWGFRVSSLFDTGIAAAFVGYDKLGLSSLLKECLDVEIPKSKKLQRADWTVRPLSRELREYAAEDVRHLHRLSSLLREELDALGRTEWAREECERLANVRYSPPDTDTAFLSVKGSRALDSRGLAVLKSLHEFREDEAVRRDRPPFKVFNDAAMLALAANPRSDLRAVKGIGGYAYGRRSSGLREAVREGLDAPPVERRRAAANRQPRVGRSDRKASRETLRLLKQWRLSQAQRLGIDPGVVWPASSLERIALDTTQMADELQCADVRRWQRDELGNSLSAFINDLNLP